VGYTINVRKVVPGWVYSQLMSERWSPGGTWAKGGKEAKTGEKRGEERQNRKKRGEKHERLDKTGLNLLNLPKTGLKPPKPSLKQAETGIKPS